MRSHKWGGKYLAPGGHVELGETLEAALRREVAEETGLSICDIRFVRIREFIYDPAFGRRPPTRLAAAPLHPKRSVNTPLIGISRSQLE
jgi:ADP-ribose pyrophosphatase YjhB (NUDIX family)